jgi:hypothetical protein
VDLFGEHSVQVVAATQAVLEAAILLTLASLLVLLSVRLAQRSASGPMLANAPSRMCRIAPPGREVDIPSARWLSTSLPSRAPPPPPDPVQRFRPTLAGERFSG